MHARKRRWAVMISGRGSNLAALLELRDEIDLRLVVGSSSQAHGLLRARRAGVSTLLTPFISDLVSNLENEQKIGPQKNAQKRIDWSALTAELRSRGITDIFLAGFMKIVPENFVADWRGRILNLHPSLLPDYPGLKSIERAHKDGSDIGVTVHEVNEEVDAGRVVCQRRCLNANEIREYSLRETEFLVHVDEQRIVKEAVRRWRSM